MSVYVTFALQSLLDESVQQRAAVVAEREALVGVHHEAVRHVHVEALAPRHTHRALLLRGGGGLKHNAHGRFSGCYEKPFTGQKVTSNLYLIREGCKAMYYNFDSDHSTSNESYV